MRLSLDSFRLAKLLRSRLLPLFEWPFSGPATLRHFLYDALKCPDAHPTLAVSGKCIVSGKRVSAKAWIWLNTRVDFSVSLQVVLSDEAFPADITAILPIAEMCLNMGFDVLFPPEPLAAFGEQADPFTV